MKRSRSTSRSRKKEKVEKGSDDDDDQPSWKRLRHARPALLPAATQRPGRAPSEVQDRNGAPRRGFEAERELFLTEKREGDKEVGRGGEAREDRSDTCQREVRATSHFGEEIGNREKEQRKNTKEKLSFSSLPLSLFFSLSSLALFLSFVRSGVSCYSRSKGHGALRLGASMFLLPAMSAVHPLWFLRCSGGDARGK